MVVIINHGRREAHHHQKEREDAKALLSAVQDLVSCIEEFVPMQNVPYDQIQVLRDKDIEFFFEPEMRILKMRLKTLVNGHILYS